MRGKVVFLTNALASPPTSPALTPAGAARDLIAILVARPLQRVLMAVFLATIRAGGGGFTQATHRGLGIFDLRKLEERRAQTLST